MSLGGATTVFEAFMATVDGGARSRLPLRATRDRPRLSSGRRGVHVRPDARGGGYTHPRTTISLSLPPQQRRSTLPGS